ncbi:MAG: flagellar biosynthesis protein [Rhodobacterales bacterium]|nr:MAG: flagellar biosynthesis protein [Rhodobacterales bacterium]
MTYQALNLEDFSATPRSHASVPAKHTPVPDELPIAREKLEKTRLEGYENGYRAGWDDCAKAEAEDQERISAEFARNLQELSFTFHEAKSHVLKMLEPLLNALIAQLLPKTVTETFADKILEEVLPLAETAADTPIEIVVSSGLRDQLESLLSSSTQFPVQIREEPTLAHGQAFLRSATEEKEVDLTSALERIKDIITGYNDLNTGALDHG